MAILTVGPNSSFPTIAAAMAAAAPDDTILFETGYSNETATVTLNGMSVSGDATSTGIVLQLARRHRHLHPGGRRADQRS